VQWPGTCDGTENMINLPLLGEDPKRRRRDYLRCWVRGFEERVRVAGILEGVRADLGGEDGKFVKEIKSLLRRRSK